MAPAAVQRVGKGNNASSTGVTFGSGDAWVTPTAGNLLVVSANGDFTSTAPTGAGTWTAGPSIVDGNGVYTWYKVATGTESTVTVSLTSGTYDFTATICEYSGASGLDAQNSSTISGVQGTSTTSTAVTTTQAGDLIVAFALIHAGGTGTPTGPSWSNGFTQALAASTGTTRDQTTYTFVGELLSAGAAGSYATSCTWTTSTGDRQEIVLAFKASAGATAKSVADTGSAADALGVVVTSGLADSGMAAEAPAAAATAGLAEAGGSSQVLTAAAGIPLADTASGAQTLAVAAATALTDAAAGADAVDNGAGTAKGLADAAAAADGLTAATVVQLADVAAAAQLLTAAATAAFTDTASASDGLSAVVAVQLGDVAAGAQALTAAAAAALADAAAALDGAAANASIGLVDTAVASQALAPTAVLALGDSGAAADFGAGADDSNIQRSLADTGTAAERLRTATLRPATGATLRPNSGTTPRP